MISTVSLSFDLTYTDPATGALQPRGIVTDSTDYAGLGIDLALAEAKGYGVITFNGEVIESHDTVLDPLINLQDGDTVFYFDLPLDLNGNVANGVYTFEYSLRLDTAATPFTILSIPDANTVVIDTTDSWLADFLESGDEVLLSVGAPAQPDVVVSSAQFNDPNVTITTSTNILSLLYESLSFDLTNVQFTGVYSYSGCTQTTADVSFTYDCEYGDSGTWGVANTTVLGSNEIVANLNCTINYPSWTTVNPSFIGSIVVTSLPYPPAGTETPLATGTYSVSLTEQIQQTQSSGLIVLYTKSVIKEFQVSCAGSLCGLTPCIENLRVAHASELQRNRISKYQVFVDNVLLYYAEAQNYRACGDTANYRATLELIKSNLDASGCECACCDENTYYWVSNNAGLSVIDGLLQSFQFRLFTLTPPGPGSPLATNDETDGVQVGALWQNTTTSIIYICTDNQVDNAVWEEYYVPGGAITAADVTAVSQPNFLNGGTVQLQLAQTDNELQLLTDAIADLPNTLNAGNIIYNATINGSIVTNVQQALEFLRISYSDYTNTLLYYSASENVATTFNNIITAKVAIRVSDTGVVQIIGNNAYDPSLSAPTMVLQVDSTYTITFPVQWMDPVYTAVHVTPTVKADSIDQIKAEALGTNTVKVAFYVNGVITTTISGFQMTIERFK
jgi:hypothetical protein